MSVVAERAASAPVARAWVSSRASVSQPVRSREQGLAAAAAPGLGQDRGGHDGDFAAVEQGAVAGPLAALAAVSGDQGAGVVGDAHQALRLLMLVPLRLDRSVASAAHWSASASSAGVKAPCSSSNWATAARPARIVNSLRAVAASQEL